jgi:hypothetical protein
MKNVGYRWAKTPSGQFVDRHERVDVVEYRQAVFLPVWEELLSRTHSYTIDSNECLILPPPAHRLVVWNHDESTYYANDHCKVCWVHKMETAIPYPKGEGPSLMVADFISPDYVGFNLTMVCKRLGLSSRPARIARDTSLMKIYSSRHQTLWTFYSNIMQMKTMSWCLTMQPLT